METKDFKFKIEIPVRFSDMDSLGHVNNAAYLTYFEESRVYYFRNLFDVPKDDLSKLKMIVLEAKCTYKSPAYSGEVLVVHTRVSKLKNKSFDMDYLITELNSGRVVAEGSSVMVGYDYATRKSAVLDDKFRIRVSEYEGIPRKDKQRL